MVLLNTLRIVGVGVTEERKDEADGVVAGWAGPFYSKYPPAAPGTSPVLKEFLVL